MDAAEHVLSGGLGSLLDSVESHCERGLPATTSSSVTGGVGADGTPGSSGVTLALGRVLWQRGVKEGLQWMGLH